MPDAPNAEAWVSVRQLLQHSFERIDLSLIAGGGAVENRITSPRIQKLGLALTGYTGYVHSGRIQFLGGTENHFLETMDDRQRALAVGHLGSRPICCIILTKGFEPPRDLTQFCEQHRVPLLRTSAVSSAAIAEVTWFLEYALATEVSLHGVLMDIYGLGVFICGDSGVGKSECALDLLIRGHRLVSDDLVCIRRRGRETLVGKGSEHLPYHMELRGLGIIDIKELFGISALSQEKTIELAIRLETWVADDSFDRLGLEKEVMEILEVRVPLRRMPVAPGRNLAPLVEVAARLQLLKRGGFRDET